LRFCRPQLSLLDPPLANMRSAFAIAVTLCSASDATMSEFQLGLVEGFNAPCSLSFNRTCSANPVPEVDVVCADGTVFVASAASIQPLDDAQARCCTARLCSGNANSTDDVNCDTGSLLPGSIVAGTDPQANCCDASTVCSDHAAEVSCEGEFTPDARVAAGGDPSASCCAAVGAYPCTGNTDASKDIVCTTEAIPGATYAATSSQAEQQQSCCTVATVRQCTGNEEAAQDVVCPAGTVVQAGEYTTGDGTVECCKEESSSNVDGEVFPVKMRMHTSASCSDAGTEVQLTSAEVSTPTGSSSECVCLSMVTGTQSAAIQLCCSAEAVFVEGANLNLTRKVFTTAACSGTAQTEDYRGGASVQDLLSGECSEVLAGLEPWDTVAAQLQQSLAESYWPACLTSELSLSSSAVAMGVSAAVVASLL